MAQVEWVRGLWSTEPRWIAEPSTALLEELARAHLHVAADNPCTVTFFAQGTFNKLYEILTPSHAAYLIRVTLPVEPRFKTLSEIATMDFVRERCNTDLVPRVLAYDASAFGNSLGFEWMMMEKLHGSVLAECWIDMSFDAKKLLVKTLVGILARLHEHKLLGIGNLYPQDAPPLVVGRIVSMYFYWDQRAKQDVPRGPFESSVEWLSAMLSLVLNDAAHTLRTSDDEDDIEEAEATRNVAQRLVALLPKIFPAQDGAEVTVIHHDDLSFQNLLVDSDGRLTGVIDWECVSALPLWRACQLPAFLDGRARDERPDDTQYAVDEDGKLGLYDEHLREWEQTQLRAVFLDEMELLQPDWVREHRQAGRRADFELAVTHCDGEFTRRRVSNWIDRVVATADGELDGSTYRSLHDDLMQ